MNLRDVIHIMALLLFVTGCGSKKADTAEALVINTPQKIEIQEKVLLKCDEDFCPTGVAMILSKTVADKKKNRCTGVLIDQEHLLTNFHCLPYNAKQVGDSCSGRLNAYFLKDDKQLNIECERVVSASGVPDPKNSNQDFAVVKLAQKVDLEPMKLNFGERYSGDKITMFKVDPVNDDFAVIKKAICELKGDTVFGEVFDGPRTPLIYSLGCETRAGNSGAPLINQKGEVIAIHQASLKKSDELKKILRGKELLNLGTATNLGCLCQNGATLYQCIKLPESCFSGTWEDSYKKREKIISESVNKYLNINQLHKQYSGEASFLDQSFKWEMSYATKFLSHNINYTLSDNSPDNAKIKVWNEFSFFLTALPYCVANTAKLRNQAINFHAPGSSYFNSTVWLESVPVCRLNVKIDQNYEIKEVGFNTINCQREKVFLDFDIETLGRKNVTAFIGFVQSSYRVSVPFGVTLNLPQCLN